MRKEMDRILAAALEQGFQVRLTRNSHYMISTADGQHVTTAPSTPSDTRGLKNCVAALRRHGFVWKGR